jgi:hypothetical protein
MTKYPLTHVTTAGVSSAFPARRKAFRGKHPEGEYPTLRRRRRGALAVYGTPDITTVLRFQFPAAPAGQTLTGANLRLRTMTLASGRDRQPTLASLPGGTAPNTNFDNTLDTSLMTGWTGSRTWL